VKETAETHVVKTITAEIYG